MSPKVYDSNSPDEIPVPLPSSPLIQLNNNIVLQPPLTRRGIGPGLVIFLPDSSKLGPSTEAKVLDPDPVAKWAEEGFAVAGVTISEPEPDFPLILRQCCEALSALDQVNVKETFGVLIYDPMNAPSILTSIAQTAESSLRIICLVAYGYIPLSTPPVPALLHLPSGLSNQLSTLDTVVHQYQSTSPYFVFPRTAGYDPGAAAMAHTRTLAFLKGHLNGPIFDLEAIWEEHTRFEFEIRSVAKTMGTMVAEPYVNHIPTMTGGIGRQELTDFYRDHFIFSNPDDARLQVVSRTVGADRIVDEFVYHITHDRMVDWLLPGVPPSGNKLSIPMLAVVNIRGDRLCHEHIWWDQATALRQAGILPLHLSHISSQGPQMIRLPVAGAEAASKLVDEASVASNAMFNHDKDPFFEVNDSSCPLTKQNE